MKDVINWLSTNQTTIGLIAGALGVSVVTQAIKHWLELENAKIIMFITILLSFITVAVTYLVYMANKNPNILGADTIYIVGWSTVIYRYVVQPLYGILLDAKTYRSNKTALSVTAAANEAINAKEEVVAAIASELQAPVATPEPETTVVSVPTANEFIG